MDIIVFFLKQCASLSNDHSSEDSKCLTVLTPLSSFELFELLTGLNSLGKPIKKSTALVCGLVAIFNFLSDLTACGVTYKRPTTPMQIVLLCKLILFACIIYNIYVWVCQISYKYTGFFYLGNHPKTGLFKHLQFFI